MVYFFAFIWRAESARLANENGTLGSEVDAIPLLLQNRIPDGFETDDKLDVSLRAEEVRGVKN